MSYIAGALNKGLIAQNHTLGQTLSSYNQAALKIEGCIIEAPKYRN